MSIVSNEGDRIVMSQRERDHLCVLRSILEGKRTQSEAARLLNLTTRQRGGSYQEGATPSSRRSLLASRIPWEAKRLTSGHF